MGRAEDWIALTNGVVGEGRALYQAVVAADLEGIVTDGGINQSLNNGATWPSLNGGGLQTALFYNIDIKPDAAASVIVGAVQDNEVGTTAGAASPLGWVGANGGDGWDAAYDGQIAGQVYSSSGFWSASTPVPCTEVFVSNDDGQTYANSTSGGITPWTTATDAGCYLAPIATDPSNGGVVYVSGSQNLWQSQNSGGAWRIIGSFAGAGAVNVAPANGNNVVIAEAPRCSYRPMRWRRPAWPSAFGLCRGLRFRTRSFDRSMASRPSIR